MRPILADMPVLQNMGILNITNTIIPNRLDFQCRIWFSPVFIIRLFKIKAANTKQKKKAELPSTNPADSNRTPWLSVPATQQVWFYHTIIIDPLEYKKMFLSEKQSPERSIFRIFYLSARCISSPLVVLTTSKANLTK
jgi:hypothetical protein